MNFPPWKTEHWRKVADQKIEIVELEDQLKELKEDRTALKEEVADLKLKKKIEDEDIKHMVKMEREVLELEFQKKTVEMEKTQQETIGTVKDEYRDKVEKNLAEQLKDIKEMYKEVLARLPNVQVKMKGSVG